MTQTIILKYMARVAMVQQERLLGLAAAGLVEGILYVPMSHFHLLLLRDLLLT
jgi:hypothetical protein